MAPLITKVRQLTSATDTAVFSDDQVQAFLDRHRVEFRYVHLCPLATRSAGGSLATYKTFELERLKPRMIEGNDGADPDAYQLLDNTYTAITPATEDLVNGRWTFATEPKRPVMIVCWAYDLYAAAVDLLDEWLGKVRTTGRQLVSFTDNGQSFKWSEDLTSSLNDLRELYAMQMCLETASIADADHAPWVSP